VRNPDSYPVFTKAAGIRYRQLTHHISLPYDDNSFNVVIASGALEHAAIDYASLQELYRVMKPDGILVITFLPNRYSYHEWYFRHIRRNSFHKRLYSMSEAIRLLKSNGFYPKKSGYTTFFWERRLADIGLKNNSLLIKLLYTVFPIHLVSGCMGIIAVKVPSM
jgi:SAM-dependent methyltransferase